MTPIPEVKKILVTGANGFLGRNIVKRAIERKWNVTAIVRRPDALSLVNTLGAKGVVLSHYTEEDLNPYVIGCDAILHFVGITRGTPQEFERINVGSAQIILNVAKKNQIPRVITPSGLGVDEYPFKDWANNPYFQSKYNIERLFEQSTQNFVIFRPSYILGPGDELIPNLVESILKGQVDVIGTGTIPMQPIYVNNAVDAFLNAAAGIGLNTHIYDLVGTKKITMMDLIHMVKQEMKTILQRQIDAEITHVPVEEAVEKLGYSKEDVAVTQCDRIGNPEPVQHQLNISLTPIESAVHAAVVDALTKIEAK
jgi:nucleoside-diphosphate-sugar epimerase